MKIESNKNLQKLNSFNLNANALAFFSFSDVDELESNNESIKDYKNRFILGGGSNVLLLPQYDGLVIFPQLFGLEVLEEDDEFVRICVGASEVWHDFVMKCLSNNWFGIENLALIPGTVGAAPVQNIGAYGIEVKDYIESVNCFDIENGARVSFSNEESRFGYRDSYFKRLGQGKIVVLSVNFKLVKKASPCITYQPLADYFSDTCQDEITPDRVAERVIEIRRAKLPDPRELPNAGSFFKNPTITLEKFQELKATYPDAVGYPQGSNKVKVAAGWLIDKAGLKGFRQEGVGVHSQQALVLVNFNENSGYKIKDLAELVQDKVYEKYGIALEPEVNILGR